MLLFLLSVLGPELSFRTNTQSLASIDHRPTVFLFAIEARTLLIFWQQSGAATLRMQISQRPCENCLSSQSFSTPCSPMRIILSRYFLERFPLAGDRRDNLASSDTCRYRLTSCHPREQRRLLHLSSTYPTSITGLSVATTTCN